LDMPQDIMRSIHDKGFSWYLYTMPMLSLGFRDLTSRIVHEDAVRAVTEGYKYQLWTFLLGDADHPPLPSEVSALQSVLGGAVIERSGYLVWRNPLKVEVHVPQGLDTLIGKDYLGYLTRQFFRKMGITPRVMSGEAPGTLGSETSGGGGGDVASIDVQLYMERVRFQEKRRIMAWLMYLIEKWVRGTSKTGIKALPKTSVRFSLTDLEMSAKVKDIFGPMYRDGASSVRTYLRAGGLQYENELANKREEQDARTEGLFNPPATFAQMVVGPQGQPQATKTVEQTEPQGSPDKAQEERNASVGLVKG